VKFVRQRLFALLGTVVFGGLFIVLLGTRVALSAVASGASSLFDVPLWVWDVVDLIVAIATMTLLVRVVYRLLPDRAPRGLAPWIGSLITALLVILGRTGVALYLSVGTVGSVYGAAGTIVVFLGWAYFCAWVFLLGAHLTYALARHWKRWPETQETPMTGVS
jgi:membrane protein